MKYTKLYYIFGADSLKMEIVNMPVLNMAFLLTGLVGFCQSCIKYPKVILK